MERKSALKTKIAINERGGRAKGVSRPKQHASSSAINPFVMRENKNKRKRQPGSNILHEIRKLQSQPENILPKASFQRVVRQICQDQYDTNIRWTSLSMKALQTSAEQYMVGLFQDSYLCSIHCKRVTMLAKDLQLARRIRGVCDPGNR